MASNSVLKSARDSGFHDNDPLAELSRIMGLAREDAANADADFHIDLEQELMGAFSEDEPRAQANDAVAPVAAVAAPVEAAADESEFDEVFSDIFEGESFEEPLDLAPEAPVVAAETAAPVVEDELTDAFLDEDFVEAFAADDFAEVDEFAEAEAAPVAEIAAVATQAATAPAFDPAATYADDEADELAAAFRDLDVVAEQHDEILEFEVEEPVAVEDVAAPVFETAATFADDEADELDAAFHDLDLAAEQAYEAEADYAPELAADEPVAAAAELEVAVAPQVNAQPAMSLEDELAALLGVASPTAVETQPVAVVDETADEVAVEAYEDDAISAEFDAAFDDAAYDEVLDEDVPVIAAESEEVADEWTAEQAVEQLFEAEPADDVLPNPLSADHLYADQEAPAADALADEDLLDDIAFDDADLDFALSDEEELAASVEIVIPQPETAEFDASDDLDAAIADFADEDTWAPEPMPAAVAPPVYAPVAAAPVAPVAETRAAPVSTFNWQSLRSEPRAPEPAAPVAAAPEVDDADPFAALAALAAAPPIMRTLGRANPVAVNPPVAERAAPRVVPPVEASRSFAAPRPIAMPAPAPTSTPAVQRAEPVQPKPVAPPLGLRPALTTAAAGSVFAAPAAARPVAETFAAKPVAAPAAPAFDDDIPDLDDLLDGDLFAPEVDTVEIQDGAVALADDLDIPEFDQDVSASQPVQFDDLDDDFTSAFNQLSNTLDQRGAAPAAAAPTYYVDRSAPAAAPAQPAPAGYGKDDYDAQFAGFDASMGEENPFDDNDAFAVDPYDADLQDEDARPSRNRGVLIAAIVAGVAIVGGIGAYAFSGGGGDDVPALVRADTTPVKVKPETPGGVVVPNQDGKVYQQVSGAPAPAPAQEKLITAAEEPIAPAAPVAAAPAAAAPTADSALPGVVAPQIKSEERVTPADTAQTPPESQDVTAMTPKKVRTMIVRPDGTLVAREELPAAAAPAADAVTNGMAAVPSAADAQTMAAAQPATVPVPSAVPGAQDDVSILPAEDAAPTVAAPAAEDVIVPEPRPAHNATPAAEPARAAAPEPAREATPEPARAAPAAEPTVEVASAPAAVAATPSLWSVQIASQPTREGAQASYEDLARRYGSVLGGKGVNIVQAEVSGKGTMWRVRVPSASKNDANILCAKLKTAGGSCFVSQ